MTHAPQNRVPSGVSVRFGPGVSLGDNTQSGVYPTADTLQCPPTSPPTDPKHDLHLAVVMTLSVLIVTVFGGFSLLHAAPAVGGQPTTRGVGGPHHPPTPCSSLHTTPYQAIDCVFPRRLRTKAKRVAECESTASAGERLARRRHLGRWASDYANHTHWGVFQLGTKERRDHGQYQIGSPALTQVTSAFDLYKQRGWKPWQASLDRCHIQ